ncbi:MAG: arginine--tRNA ligase, partial [Candidatus Saccharimonadales bacterium]
YNSAVYQFHQQDDHTSPLAQIYWQCRDWSYAYFKRFYAAIQVKPFDKFYPESSVIARGQSIVKAHHGTVFVDSDGAVVFRGEAVGQHTRVFITSAGLPTYETKDLGVILTEVDDFAYDRRIIMTGNDQVDYMRVVFAALKQIDEPLAAKQVHLTNGTVRFGDGRKMSSRLGNVLTANQVLEAVGQAVEAPTEQLKRDITLGAIKYAFLKQRLGGDIAFDIEESVSLQGNSGPYLQYAHARACSILGKAADKSTARPLSKPTFEAGERSLVRQLGQFQAVVDQSIAELSPHLICTYLYELAQVFNRFYEKNRVLDDPRQAVRLALVQLYAQTLRTGLELLNIPAPRHI